MGKWITTNTGFRSFLSDRIGYKSGLALSNNEMIELMDKTDPLIDIFKNPNEELVKIPTNYIEDTFQIILYRLGATKQEFIGHAPTLLDIEFINNPKQRSLFKQVLRFLGETHFDQGKNSIFDDFDEDKYYHLIQTNLGTKALDIAHRLVAMTKESEEASPWDWLAARVTEWKSPIELKNLFESESLVTMYGSFLDQRYINYLVNNTSQLSTMHWRKFEALTAEYFERKGYVVEIGAGRNDGGIDARVWSQHSNPSDSPVQLVQCKRTK